LTLEALTSRLLALGPQSWSLLLVLVAVVVALIYLVIRRREHSRARATLEEAVRTELHVPASLHPVIDPDVCIGSGSCIQACPEGRILGLVDGVAKLINASSCIGHGRCAAECPVSAIKLVFGSAERGVDLPEIDGSFETSRPGVYIVGELGGMGLIKNALTQGLQVAARLRAALGPAARRAGDLVDVAIVGAGPAGIAAAVGARAAGLSYALLEQDTVGGAIAHYPRQKLVMTEAVNLPFHGRFGRPFMSKEDLLATLERVIADAGIEVHERARVLSVDGQLGDFLVTSSRGVLRARRVVLAIGRRGAPRPLGVPGHELPKITYRLVDPSQYQGKRVLVVGGGDSALEAVAMLADQTSAEVGIVHRGTQFARGRALNRQKMESLRASGRVRAFMSTEVSAVEPDAVHLTCGGKTRRVANDFVIACLGGEVPGQFLKTVGVDIRHHRGDRAMANPTFAGDAPAPGDERLAATTLALVGVAILVFLALAGGRYYMLPDLLRYRSPLHRLMKPSGSWGHGIGILATCVMLLNFVYPIRKRARWLKRRGSIAPWLRFHVFVGTLTPPVILFHSAFRWGNALATATYVSLVIVVVTGLVGRFIYGLFRVDAEDGKRAATLRVQLRPMLAALASLPNIEATPQRAASLARLSALAEAPGALPASLCALLLGMPGEAWALRRAIGRLEGWFVDRRAFPAFRAQLLDLRRRDVKLHFHQGFKRLMHGWRIFHVALSVVLLGLIGAHIWISLRIGFKWLWS
jgi:thioredoxin reductase/Pyruvate/2-oxoacid:ferredoxin oxidoreductase delta subunit